MSHIRASSSVSECSGSVDDSGFFSVDEFHSFSLSDLNGNGSSILNPDLVVKVDVDSLTHHLYWPLPDPDELAQLPERKPAFINCQGERK